ncbi:Uncharacterised protein [Mycobacteroides abscessus subsp. abscessus]|jgi:hypothetical protein|uniref:hypothetical protein n=1 Tax=Mycobacteroides abscessus TaxID=36809 RepID=UPI00092689A2|nr:hypothetical protein [Mycobacteroides abscessus]SIH22466.1 Uncharacterised protein [Mycobacteroides abscessus subsp. abscessus]
MQTQSATTSHRAHRVTLTGRYDLDLQNSGYCWTSTYGKTIAATAADILEQVGFFGPVEISYGLPPHMQTVTGVLVEATSDTLTVMPLPTAAKPDPSESFVTTSTEPVTIGIAGVRRFRA